MTYKKFINLNTYQASLEKASQYKFINSVMDVDDDKNVKPYEYCVKNKAFEKYGYLIHIIKNWRLLIL